MVMDLHSQARRNRRRLLVGVAIVAAVVVVAAAVVVGVVIGRGSGEDKGAAPQQPVKTPEQPPSDGDGEGGNCLLYTSPSPRDVEESRMPSSA